jgi:cell division septum initiation protein DivIVA
MTTDEELDQLRQENSALRDQVARLSERISRLEAQLAKDSYNSHLPPVLRSLSSTTQESAQAKQQAARRAGGSYRKHAEVVGDTRSGDRAPGGLLPALSARPAGGGESASGPAPSECW